MARKRSQKIEELLDTAVALSPDEQRLFLDRECGDDIALRKEVEESLAVTHPPRPNHPRKKHSVITPRKDTRTDWPAERGVLNTMVGQKVGRYRITEKLGQGGMGIVFAAVHEKLSTRAVVKVLHEHLSQNTTMAKRFENEAMAAAKIGHPGIVKIMDIGTLDDGSLFILMEYLEGESLARRLDNAKSLPEETVVSFIRQAAGALSAAHAKDIVHRDLKPDNIFLVPDPEIAGGERVTLLDFGIAKLTESEAGLSTNSGALLGTPPYMSPEQCRGAGRVDYRTDLYALGVILFEMLCGRRPFRESTPGHYIAAHLTKAPPPVKELRPDVSPGVAEIVARLLNKDPEQRFESMRALVTALDVAMSKAGASVAVTEGRPTSAPAPARRPMGRATIPVGLALTAAVMIAVGVTVWPSGDSSRDNNTSLTDTATAQAVSDAGALSLDAQPTEAERLARATRDSNTLSTDTATAQAASDAGVFSLDARPTKATRLARATRDSNTPSTDTATAQVASDAGALSSNAKSTKAKRSSLLGRTILLQSVNHPERFVSHGKFLGKLTPIRSAVDKRNASFRVVKGLDGKGTISFESVHNPGRYLRHQKLLIKLHKFEDSRLFREDASFKVRDGLSGTGKSFESVNVRGHYLRHCQYQLRIDNNKRGDKDCLPRKYEGDVTFNPLNPKEISVP